MRKRIQPLGLLGFSFLFVLTACEPKEELPDRATLVQQALTKRIEQYKKSNEERCYKNVLQQAKILVDSTMLANAGNIKVVDSLPRPPKPAKPDIPVSKSLKDTLKLAPLLPLDSVDSR